MKKMILTLVAVIAISSTALAQDQQGPRPDHQPARPRLRPPYPCACDPSA